MSYNDTLEISERLIYGYDGTNARAIKTNSSGEIISETPPDTTITWTDGNPTQIVEVYTDRTVTTDLTWVDGNPTELNVTVT